MRRASPFGRYIDIHVYRYWHPKRADVLPQNAVVRGRPDLASEISTKPGLLGNKHDRNRVNLI